MKLIKKLRKSISFKFSDHCDIRMLELPANAEKWTCTKPIQLYQVPRNSKCKVVCETGYRAFKSKE